MKGLEFKARDKFNKISYYSRDYNTLADFFTWVQQCQDAGNEIVIQQFSKWISVKSSLPGMFEHVLGYDEFYRRVGEAKMASWGDEHLIFIDSDDCFITHWQQLPESPIREPVLNVKGETIS